MHQIRLELLTSIILILSVVENSYSGVLRSTLRRGESAFFFSGEGDWSGELKGPGECLRSTPGILRHNIVFSCKITVFDKNVKLDISAKMEILSKISYFSIVLSFLLQESTLFHYIFVLCNVGINIEALRKIYQITFSHWLYLVPSIR